MSEQITLKQSSLRIIWFIVLAMILFCLDAFSKAYVYRFSTVIGGLSPPLFYHFWGVDFFIALATNRGAAWGMFADFQITLIIVRIVIVIAMLFYLFVLNRNRLFSLPLVLITVGAIGNIIDFFLYGFVIDFLNFNLWGYHFPVFNLADAFITIGVGWLFLLTMYLRT